MKPIFTIHAGEYLVGSYIEQNFKECNVWIPSKDSGIDLLITNKQNSKTVSIQVKFSKDFLITHIDEGLQKGLKACGWWTLNRDKIITSIADYWVFVIHSFHQKNYQFVIISPQEYLKKIDLIHGNIKTIQTYLWVTEKNKCWETRELKSNDQKLVENDCYEDTNRDFRNYLNNWSDIVSKLNQKL